MVHPRVDPQRAGPEAKAGHMGASFWSYFVPYQADLGAALQALREKVFAEGDYC